MKACSSAGSIGDQAIASDFGRDGEELIIPLGGGSKKGQQGDISRAKDRWSDYRNRKAQE